MGNETLTAAEEEEKKRDRLERNHLTRILRLERDEAQENLACTAATLDLDRESFGKLEHKYDSVSIDLAMAREFARDVWKRARTADLRGRALALFNRFSKTLGMGFSEKLSVENGQLTHTTVQEHPDFKVTFRGPKAKRARKAKKGGR